MKLAKVFRLLFAILLVVLVPALRSQDAERLQALATSDASPTFSLALSSKSPEYRIGSQMWFTIAQTNLTKHDIDCTSDWDGIDRMYQYEATDEDGKPVEKRHRGTESYTHGCTMAAGEHLSNEIQLERVFKLDRPGKYIIRVSRPEPFVKDEKGEHPVIWSNPITITITG
jgi:hypothetical protein